MRAVIRSGLTTWPAVMAILAALLGVLAARGCRPARPAELRFATFNIEDFPRNARQVSGAVALIDQLDVGFVAVQEIIRPDVLRAAAHARLGSEWQLAYASVAPLGAADATGGPGAAYPTMHVGVLFDGEVFTLRSQAVHDDTRLDGRNKPVLEVRLAPRGGGPVVQIFVVHFKAGAEGRPLRARQYEALAGLLARVSEPDERVVVLGDFNATADADRVDLAALARRTSLRWATEDLGCSAFWQREDDCPTSRLDHVLTGTAPVEVTAAGACATVGCGTHDTCPLYRDEISDHCPVVVRAR